MIWAALAQYRVALELPLISAYDIDVKLPIFGSALLLLVASVAACQEHPHSDIVVKLMPDGNPSHLARLSPAEQNQAVRQLQSEQKQASAKRRQELAFLLAAMDSDYEKNRDYLVHILRGCTDPSIKFGCDLDTGGFLIALYERGHKDVLKPLMLYGKDSYNAALAEMLGAFYSDVLAERASEFLDTIRGFTPRTQARLCELAGTGDGGGIAKKDLQKARKALKAIGDEIAMKCLRAVETANKPE